MGLDESFALVSLDPDLYDPTYDGLCYFWPRLSEGGYILVHDYNVTRYPGPKKAVHRFAAETGACWVPVSDMYGTAIFVKGRSGN